MCGIAGFSLSKRERINANKLSSALLLGIEERGQPATGAAWHNPTNDEIWIQKDAVTASEFVKNNGLAGNTRAAILHTRWATKGDVSIPANNHPIDVKGLVGIHNGCIFNDDEIFERIGSEKRIAQVDSEAIFANLLHGEGETVEKLSEVKGSAAVAWLDATGPDSVHIARISSSPLVIATTAMGSVIFASTENAIRKGANSVGMKITNMMRLDEGGYLEFLDGQVIQSATFSAEKRVLSDTEKRALNLV